MCAPNHGPDATSSGSKHALYRHARVLSFAQCTSTVKTTRNDANPTSRDKNDAAVAVRSGLEVVTAVRLSSSQNEPTFFPTVHSALQNSAQCQTLPKQEHQVKRVAELVGRR